MARRLVNPIQHFSIWFRAASKGSPGPWFDPAVMTLATAGKNGDVSARMVLLKKFGPDGFVFYTNLESRKAIQLGENPRAALVFYWPYLNRQVRIEGTVEPVSRKEVEEYFHSRPRLSQLAAAASKQSQVIPSRKFLVKKFNQLRTKLSGVVVPVPETWGGYQLVPDRFEFWVHREHRLHDRVQYRKQNGKWIREYLSP